MPDVRLTVNGLTYAGWKTARIVRSIEALAGGFELTVSDRWEAGRAPWAIREEDICVLSVGSTRLIVGYVDSRTSSYSASEHSLGVTGRDTAAALIDNSAYVEAWELKNVSILDLARRLAEPFGVTASLESGLSLPKLSKVSIDPGDKGADVLERACRKLGVLAVSDGSGGIVLMRPGTERTHTALIEGENVLSASASYDATGRYRRYVVLGQSAATDEWYGEGTAGVKGEATDGTVLRGSRVLVVRAEGNVNAALAKKRAEWEATVRAARGDSVTVTVQGWTQGNGELWPINRRVQVTSPTIGVDGEMLIAQTVLNTGDGGTTTELTLRAPNAFAPEPEISGTDQTWKEIRHGV